MKNILPPALILTSFFLGLIFYPQLPNTLAVHWGINGQVDGYGSKSFGLFFMPTIMFFLYIFTQILPHTDPYKKNFKQFQNHFNTFTSFLFTFFLYFYLLILFWNLGYRFNLVQFLSPGFAFLFYYSATLVSVARRNWFVGIRTPWTLSSDKVWNKTHILGTKLFRLSAAITLLGTIFPSYAYYLMLVPILASTIAVFIFSYFEYRKTNN